MFRLPRGVLDAEAAGQYCATDTASLTETGTHLILSLSIDQEEADDYWDEPGGQLAAMVQARSELAAGDLRLLYLAWLLALQSDEDSAAFRERFLALRTQHDRKPTLQERFDQAGLPS